MGDYFAHWLKLGRAADPAKLPPIYLVNWFRKDRDGAFLWPGYGDNARVLEWIVERIEGRAAARTTPIGNVATPDSLDLDGLNLRREDVELLLSVDPAAWEREADLIEEDQAIFGARLPGELKQELAALRERLANEKSAGRGERDVKKRAKAVSR
jgi:phosphoenolpyruvate carboxykinase (GTP)